MNRGWTTARHWSRRGAGTTRWRFVLLAGGGGLAVLLAVGTQRADTDRALEAIGRLHDVASQLGRLESLTDELQQQIEADPSNTLIARAVAALYIRELEYSRALAMLDLVLKHN